MTFHFRQRSTSLRAMVLVSFVLPVAAIAVSKGFSNPYGEQTGPAAWEPPIHPYLIGGVFKLSGIDSSTSAIVLLTINRLVSDAERKRTRKQPLKNTRGLC